MATSATRCGAAGIALLAFAYSAYAGDPAARAATQSLLLASVQPGVEAAMRGSPLPEAGLLRSVNERYNAYRWVSDVALWGEADYWATPLELQARGAGDCEDFAIAKYFHLRRLGVPESRLRLMVAGLLRGPRISFELHMVLIYYATPESDPLVLDNVTADIHPLSQRGDLVPRLAFNREGWWSMQTGIAQARSGPVPIVRWHGLLARVEAERLAALAVAPGQAPAPAAAR